MVFFTRYEMYTNIKYKKNRVSTAKFATCGVCSLFYKNIKATRKRIRLDESQR